MIPKRILDTYTFGTVNDSHDIQVMSTDPHVQLDLVVFVVIWRSENWENLAGVIALRKPRAITWTTKVRYLHDSFEGLLDSTRAALANEYRLCCDLKVPEHLDLKEATIGDLVTCVRKQVYAVKGWKRKLRPKPPHPEDVQRMTPTWFAKHPPVKAPRRCRKADKNGVTLPCRPGTQWWVMWENTPRQVTVARVAITVLSADGKQPADYIRVYFGVHSGVEGGVHPSSLFRTKEALLASL